MEARGLSALMEKFYNWILVLVTQFYNFIKIIELYIFNELILWYVIINAILKD